MSTMIFEILAPPGSRSCGRCTACCKTHSVDDPELTKSMGEWCIHCDKGRGCRIYNHRPGLCREFFCQWMMGAGEEKHRPDRVKVVLDYVNLPNGLPGGVLQIWEVTEGALSQPYAQQATREALEAGVWVSHVYLRARKKRIFVPPSKELTEHILCSIREEGTEVCNLNYPLRP